MNKLDLGQRNKKLLLMVIKKIKSLKMLKTSQEIDIFQDGWNGSAERRNYEQSC